MGTVTYTNRDGSKTVVRQDSRGNEISRSTQPAPSAPSRSSGGSSGSSAPSSVRNPDGSTTTYGHTPTYAEEAASAAKNSSNGSSGSSGGSSSSPSPAQIISQPPKQAGESPEEYIVRTHPTEYGQKPNSQLVQQLTQQAKIMEQNKGYYDESQAERNRVYIGDVTLKTQADYQNLEKAGFTGQEAHEIAYGGKGAYVTLPSGQTISVSSGVAAKIREAQNEELKAYEVQSKNQNLTKVKITEEQARQLDPMGFDEQKRGLASSAGSLLISRNIEDANYVSDAKKKDFQTKPQEYYAYVERPAFDSGLTTTNQSMIDTPNQRPSSYQKSINDNSESTLNSFEKTRLNLKQTPAGEKARQAMKKGIEYIDEKLLNISQYSKEKSIVSNPIGKFGWGVVGGVSQLVEAPFFVVRNAEYVAPAVAETIKHPVKSIKGASSEFYEGIKEDPIYSISGLAIQTVIGGRAGGKAVKSAKTPKTSPFELAEAVDINAEVERGSVGKSNRISKSERIAETPKAPQDILSAPKEALVLEKPIELVTPVSVAKSAPKAERALRLSDSSNRRALSISQDTADLGRFHDGGEVRGGTPQESAIPPLDEVAKANKDVLDLLKAQDTAIIEPSASPFPKEVITGEGVIEQFKPIPEPSIRGIGEKLSLGEIITQSKRGRAISQTAGEEFMRVKLPESVESRLKISKSAAESSGKTLPLEVQSLIPKVHDVFSKNIPAEEVLGVPKGTPAKHTKAYAYDIGKVGEVTLPDLFGGDVTPNIKATLNAEGNILSEEFLSINKKGITVRGAKVKGVTMEGLSPESRFNFESVINKVGKNIYRVRTAIPQKGLVSDIFLTVKKSGTNKPTTSVKPFEPFNKVRSAKKEPQEGMQSLLEAPRLDNVQISKQTLRLLSEESAKATLGHFNLKASENILRQSSKPDVMRGRNKSSISDIHSRAIERIKSAKRDLALRTKNGLKRGTVIIPKTSMLHNPISIQKPRTDWRYDRETKLITPVLPIYDVKQGTNKGQKYKPVQEQKQRPVTGTQQRYDFPIPPTTPIPNIGFDPFRDIPNVPKVKEPKVPKIPFLSFNGQRIDFGVGKKMVNNNIKVVKHKMARASDLLNLRVKI